MSDVIGNVRRLAAVFRVGTTDTDPTVTTLRILSPAGVVTVYVYGASAVVRTAAGRFYFDLPLTVAGTYVVRWEGTGPAAAASELLVTSEPSALP